MCNKAGKVSWYLWCPRHKAYKRETVHQSKEAGQSKGQGTELWKYGGTELWKYGQTNPNRVTVRDADNKGLYTLDVSRETTQKCKIFRHEMFWSIPSPWLWQIFATETLENVWHSRQKRRINRSSSSSNDFVLTMLSKKGRSFGVHPPHLLK